MVASSQSKETRCCLLMAIDASKLIDVRTRQYYAFQCIHMFIKLKPILEAHAPTYTIHSDVFICTFLSLCLEDLPGRNNDV